MDPNAQAAPSIPDALLTAPNSQSEPEVDPLVQTWRNRITAAQKHWDRLHKRMRHNRKLVRGIDDTVEPNLPQYNKQRANLIQSTLTVVLSKVYAKNPEMSAEPTNKARDLRLLCDTVSNVTQVMLEDAKLKKKAKATVRAAMTCSYGIVKVMYQRDMMTDPLIKSRIEDAQENIRRIDSLLKDIKDEEHRSDQESKRRELEEQIASLEAEPEVVAAEGLVIDRVRSDRLLVDPAVEDIWEYEAAGYMVEEIPMRKSIAQGMFKDFDLKHATTFKLSAADGKDPDNRSIYSPASTDAGDDPIIKVFEVWSKQDNRVYTIVDGCTKQFARKPYTPQRVGERWWPYFILPFQSVDGEFAAQSLVDVLERLQEEHNETRDKFAEVRRNIKPHMIVSGDVKDKDITVRQHAVVGEMVVVNTNGGKLADFAQQANQLIIDPMVYDTAPIRNDWEQVSGLQDAARSVVVSPKTATEASISDQSLAARVAEFRDQVEDWLTEIAQYASELCLLNMTQQQVETIMGQHAQPNQQDVAAAVMAGKPPPDGRAYEWPQQASPETVFNLVQLRIRSGSTAAPNKLQMQENWSRAMPLIEKAIMVIRQIDAMPGGDSTPERELLKETAARFDETIDVERFLPPKPAPVVAPAMPGMGGGIPMPDPASLPMQ